MVDLPHADPLPAASVCSGIARIGPGAPRTGKIPQGRNGCMFPPPHVTRLDAWRLTRRSALLSFRRFLRVPRTLGIGVARRARAGKDVSAGPDSDRCFFSPFSTRQLRRNHFSVAIGLAPSGRISGGLRWHRCRPATRGDPSMARGPRNGPAISPSACPSAPIGITLVTFLRARFSVSARFIVGVRE